MKENETIELFVKALWSLKCNVVLNASVQKGVVEVHVNLEDDEAVKKMNLTVTDKMLTQASYLMLSNVHTENFGKETTDRVLREASRGWFSSWIPCS